ncbi:MAG: 2-amino-4-hydroxy-6-hydroxymethyldihydropteridine diphosphokinase, partial [Robiginitalea sp.]
MKQQGVTAYVSLGSNLGNRAFYLQKAIFLLGDRAGVISTVSPVYRSEAWGFDGEDFLNACLSLQTALKPEILLQTLLDIERDLGRERSGTGGYRSRTIDLDLLYYGAEVLKSEFLTVPHPHLHKRRFVVKPLSDIAPQLYH